MIIKAETEQLKILETMEVPNKAKGDLDTFVRSELPRLYRIAVRMTGSRDQADDLVGITLMYAAKSWKDFDGRFPIAWLHRIMQNAYIRLNQNELKHQTIALEQVAEKESRTDIHQETLQRIEIVSLMESLHKLSPDHRAVITLCDIEEINYDQVALILEIPRGTLCSRLYRARRALIALHHEIAL